MYKALFVDELNPVTDLSNNCPTFGLIEYIILEKKRKNIVNIIGIFSQGAFLTDSYTSGFEHL